MLEQPGLVLGPWVSPAGTPGASRHGDRASRAVLDPTTRDRLGVVRRRWSAGWPWVRWLGRQTLAVYEAEDESLLCTVQTPSWLMRIGEVFAADERRIAILHGPRVLDWYAQPLAEFRPTAGSRLGRFVATDGLDLGQLTKAGLDTILQFSPAVAEQPFVKMALLGATLCHA
jgi:hypothetical protein